MNRATCFILICALCACSRTRENDQTTAAADTAAAVAPADSPVVQMRNGTPVLQLPAAMRSALDAYAPAYQPWTLAEYDERVSAKQAELGALFGVVADYNGDGRVDVALDGRADGEELLFVILSNADAYRVVELLRRPRDPSHQPRQEYLELYPAGIVDIPEGLREVLAEEGTAVPSRFDLPAVHHITEGHGGIAYYWKDGRFQTLVTGD